MGKSADPANQGAILKTVPRTRLPFSDVVNTQPLSRTSGVPISKLVVPGEKPIASGLWVSFAVQKSWGVRCVARVAEGGPVGTAGAATNEKLPSSVALDELFMESPINCRNNAQPLVRTDFRPLPPIVAFSCMETGRLSSGRLRSQTCLARTNPLSAPPHTG